MDAVLFNLPKFPGLTAMVFLHMLILAHKWQRIISFEISKPPKCSHFLPLSLPFPGTLSSFRRTSVLIHREFAHGHQTFQLRSLFHHLLTKQNSRKSRDIICKCSAKRDILQKCVCVCFPFNTSCVIDYVICM